MSLSEIFDHGVPIPWANFRFNNVSIDGTNNSIVPAPATGGPTGTISRLFAKGTLRITTTAATNTVYTFTLPVTPANPNGAFNLKFVTLFKGGPVGNTNNGFYQETLSYGVTTANALNSHLFYNNINLPVPLGGAFQTNVSQDLSSSLNGVTLGVHNTNAGHTTDVMWYVQVDYFIDNL